jgi:hypothetical protein
MAKQLTVRGLDAALEQRLHAEARRRGLSVNRTTLDLLRQAVGLAPRTPRPETGPFTDLDHLAGTWTPEEAQAFDHTLAGTRRVDRELWP